MLVCHCHVVYDDALQAAIAQGAGSPEEVAVHCGAGTTCGGCHDAIDDLLERAEAAVDAALELA